jgi:NAD(P)-dependent dehydrogenase (short-subunit alcohol dehydrogenase family)
LRNLKLGRFAGKVAIVTGASSGIGEGTANLLAAEGARVIVADLDVEGGQRTVDRIATGGGEAVFVEADVSEAAQVQQMVAQTVEVFGRLDILHNNAIWYENAPATELEETVWDRTLNTGLKAIFLAAKYAIPAMLKTGGGSIVNTGSVHSLVGFETHTAYDAAKAGVLGITRVLALDYGPAIRVNAVLPGAILTPLWDRMKVTADDRRRLAEMVPAKRLGTAADIANAVLFLASDEASFVTGASLVVDGGMLARTM